MSKDKNAEINEFYNKTQNLKSDFSKEMMNEEGDFYKGLIRVIHDSNLEFNIFKENNKDMSELDSIVLPLVKELVEDFGASVNPTTPSYLPHALATPLGAAIDNLLLEVVQYLLKKGADITYAVHGKTLLEFMKEVSAENDNIFDVEIFDIENPEEISENNNNEENSDHDNSSETPIIGEDNNNDSPSDIN